MSVTSALILRSIAQRCVSKDEGGPILRDARKSALLRMRPSFGTTVICHEPSVSRASVAAAKLQDPADASLTMVAPVLLKQITTRSQGRGAVLAKRLDDVAAD